MLIVNSPGRRERAERFVADLLTRHWELLSDAERKEAVEAAVEFGIAFAQEWHDEADLDAYVDVVVWWAFDALEVVNEVEFALWKTGDPEDPRVLAFGIGCAHWRKDH